jgi:hypothetical protein
MSQEQTVPPLPQVVFILNKTRTPPRFPGNYALRGLEENEISFSIPSAPLKSIIFISTYCDNGGLPHIAVPVGDAGENDDLAFLGCRV